MLLRAGIIAALALAPALTTAAVTCPNRWTTITAKQFNDKLNPGWNSGNSLDATPDETSWGQPLLVNSTFTNVKKNGFKGVRIPVTWDSHITTSEPDFIVDPKWLQRVSDVVDMAISNGLYTIVNAHHDSWIWLNPTASGFNQTYVLDRFYKLWYQVGTKLACKSNMLAFETVNEPSGDTSSQHDADFLNSLHATLIRAIRDAGGFNSKRVVYLCGLSDGWTTAVQFLQLPANMTNPWGLTWHLYGPWDFTATAFGRTIWGNAQDKQDIYDSISQSRGNFSDVPLLIGEFAASPVNTETAARWKWFDYIAYTAQQFGTSVMLWDAGGSFAVNSTSPYSDMPVIKIIDAAAAGIKNALPDSTVDESFPTQFTSAYLFHKHGDKIADTDMPFLWNNNTVKSISCSGPCPSTLRKGIDYTTNSQNLTIKTCLMERFFPKNSESGRRANMTIHFQKAADLFIPAVQWAPPVLGSNSSTVTANNMNSDLHIPITYQGLAQLAMVKILLANGTLLVDTWLQWAGPMQYARSSYSFDWDYDAQSVILKASTLQQAYAAQIATNFTFEFYPRQPDNTANYTLYY